jgi:hypothetical protein
VHTPVEQAVAQAVTRTASKGRALALPILSSAHYNSQTVAIRLLQKYQGDRYVRIDVLDTATGFVEDPFDLFDF